MTRSIVIPHGTTPTGFGLVLHPFDGGPESAQWAFRPISPCCGEFMESRDTSHDIRCVVCSESYEGFATECLGTLGNDVPFQQDATDETTFPRWIARIMGFPNAEATHNVKVWITWD